MRNDELSVGDVQQGQQQLRENIEISTRLIGEAQQRVETSRALTGEAGPANDAEADPDAA